MSVNSLEEVEARYWKESETSTGGHLERFAYLLETGLWSDVRFVVGKEKEVFKVHKLILRAGSKILHDLLNQDKDEFEVPDLDPNEFRLLLKFLYTGEKPEKIEDALPLLNAASGYQVSSLVRICGELLAETLTKDNALKIYRQALKYCEKELEERAMKCICSFGYEVIKSPEFLEVSIEELVSILARDDLQIPNEVKLFEAMMNWGRAECKRQNTMETHKYLRSMLEKVIPLIRFPLMDSTDFGLKVVPTNILLTEEVMSVLVYFGVRQPYRSGIPTGVFSTQARMAYVPRGEEFVLKRLAFSGSAVVDLGTNTNTGYSYIPPSAIEHSIRLKSSVPIWVTSIGMNSTFPDCTYDPNLRRNTVSDDILSVQIELKDSDKNVLATSLEKLCEVRTRTADVCHIEFDDPVYMLQDEWYSATFTVKTGKFIANNYRAVDGIGTSLDFKLTDGSESVIKFEFRNGKNPKYTGVYQGFIPEIGFMVD